MAAAFSANAALAQEHQHEHHTHEPKEEELPGHEGPENMGMERGMSAFPGPAELQFSHGREGSGTSWMPDSSPVYAHHFMAGDWMLMLHYATTLGYDDPSSDPAS